MRASIKRRMIELGILPRSLPPAPELADLPIDPFPDVLDQFPELGEVPDFADALRFDDFEELDLF